MVCRRPSSGLLRLGAAGHVALRGAIYNDVGTGLHRLNASPLAIRYIRTFMWFVHLGNFVDRLAVDCGAVIGFDEQTTRQLYRFVLVGIVAFGFYLATMALGVET